MENKIELSIVMPCLNEEETLDKCIIKAKKFLEETGIYGEIIIADNGSTDNSHEIANSHNTVLIHIKEKGYGNAIIGGSKAAKGLYIIMGDSDDSYDFSKLMPYIEKLREGYDLVMGNRFKGGIMKGAMPFLHRYLGNPVLSFIGRLFFNIPVGDFHCGLRGYSKTAFYKMNLVTTGMEFASEMVVKASLNKMKITEVPTTLSKDGRTRPPHLRTWHDGWRHLRFLMLYSPKWLFLFPGLIFIFMGLIFSVLITIKPIIINNIVFDIHTLLFTTSSILIGYLFVTFYVFSKYFAILNGLLPENNFVNNFVKFFSLERGLFIGGTLLLSGFILAFYSLLIWGKTHFGNLEPTHSLRIVIPSVLLIQLGVQTIISSFFISILGLKKQ